MNINFNDWEEYNDKYIKNINDLSLGKYTFKIKYIDSIDYYEKLYGDFILKDINVELYKHMIKYLSIKNENIKRLNKDFYICFNKISYNLNFSFSSIFGWNERLHGCYSNYLKYLDDWMNF